ncbi:MAG TPA: gephyrin-like molybdotransferase Glp [Gemmatimonadaceae bacterium]|jgi:molybdopterin molybdotransferase|nr:gephyrin-like molybdotransferase Glp [Gemmatimonadaceae bacterium]
MAYSVHEASARILAPIRALATERVPVREAHLRVLAEDVVSPIEHPPWDNSSMDGYAVRSGDVVSASGDHPVRLPVLETVAAGQQPTRPLAPNTAIRVMTGAPIPSGSDTVIRVEDTDGGETTVEIRDTRDVHRNVRPRGEDLQVGAIAVPRGTIIAAAQLGVLASVGCATPLVHRVPRVAVLSSGDELVDLDGFDAVRRGERIVSSNSYTLGAAAREAGAEVLDLGIVPDDPAAYVERIRAARGCDLLLTSGGVSVGAFDFTKDVLKSLGAELHLWRIRMRPGAPLGFGILDGMPWLGLPGNPVSAMVTFELFGKPLIRRQRGESELFPRPIEVRVREDIEVAAPLTHFMRGIIRWQPDGVWAELTGPQGSGLLTSMARANALLVVPPERPLVRAGETLRALPLAGAGLASQFDV